MYDQKNNRLFCGSKINLLDISPHFLRRCFDLAFRSAGHVAPNPLVGAVLVHNDRIIGEGRHERYGEAHAEVNCIKSVAPENQHLISQSTLYCNLEPCFHFGKTPPCVDLILQQEIPRVVISNTDPNPKVSGQSIQKMREAGVQVITGILEAEGLWLNRVFFKWIREKTPYVILKWAQSRDGFLGRPGERTAISGPAAQRLVHKWRGEIDAIVVGANTAVVDNPRLDTRFYGGRPPLRIALDRQGRIPGGHHLLDDSAETWIYGPQRGTHWENTSFFPTSDSVLIPNLLQQLHAANRAALLVEGGAAFLQQFINGRYWDEIRVIENENYLYGGLPAPQIPVNAVLKEQAQIGPDTLRIFYISQESKGNGAPETELDNVN